MLAWRGSLTFKRIRNFCFDSFGPFRSWYDGCVNAYLIVITAIALPVVLGILMRVSASHLFFTVMAGELLARYFGHQTFEILESLTHNTTIAGFAEPILLTLPLLLTALFLKGSLSKGKTILHVVPFLVTGFVYVAFLVPILPYDVRMAVQENTYTSKLAGIDGIVIGVIVFFQLVALWLLNAGGEKHGKHKK